MFIRTLRLDDWPVIGELLSQLSPTLSKATQEDWEQFFHNYETDLSKTIFVCCDEIVVNQIIGCGSLIVEQKIIHNFGKVGHIEDLVIDKAQRKKGYGKMLVDFLINKAKEEHACYKVILNCSEKNKCFYEKCGFRKNEVQMVIYFE